MAKKTLGLSIIVKNEEHVIERMLNTVYPILDYYTIVDTGSTDNTKEVIKKFFDEKGIPGQILDKTFDNFENCRNYAMEASQGKTDYAMWIDADEELIIHESFDKNKLDKDLYMINTHIGYMRYTRNELWNTKKKFKWYGPVHEYIIPLESNITSGIADGLEVNVHMDGGSWKAGAISQKYKRHADMLEEYIMTDRNPRWVFYTAQSWHDSATTGSRVENDERLRRSLKYYRERASSNDGYHEERFYSQFRVGLIRKILEDKWSDVKTDLLKAYSIDPTRGESIKIIIEHYQKIGEWALANMYSEFAYNKFHNNSPYPNRLLFVDESLYIWRFLELHMNSSFYMKEIEEAQRLAKELMEIVNKNPNYFSDQDKQRIVGNTSQIMGIKTTTTNNKPKLEKV